MANHEVPGSLTHFKAVCEIEAPQIVLPPTERRPSDAREKLLGSFHEPTLASARQPENVPVQIRGRRRPVCEGQPR